MLIKIRTFGNVKIHCKNFAYFISRQKIILILVWYKFFFNVHCKCLKIYGKREKIDKYFVLYYSVQMAMWHALSAVPS